MNATPPKSGFAVIEEKPHSFKTSINESPQGNTAAVFGRYSYGARSPETMPPINGITCRE
jgi:hypothetical protein